MDILFFLTDRYPFGKGETFIENEVDVLSERFDIIYVFPMALTADVSYRRSLPSNFVIFPPANTDNLYKNGHPSTPQRIKWFLKHLLRWSILTLFTKEFWLEVFNMLRNGNFSFPRVYAAIRYLAPVLRNIHHFRKTTKDIVFESKDRYFIYSYWFNNSVYAFPKCIDNKVSTFKHISARAHGVDLYTERHSCNYIPFRERTFEFLDSLSLISSNGYDYITQRYPNYKGKCNLSYLGTKDYGLCKAPNSQEFVIASCSALVPVKRVELIIDTLSTITETSITWIHIGGGQFLKDTIAYAQKKLGASNNIKFLFKGQMTNQELMKFYSSTYISLFINVSESEGMPVSIMEAISFGIPVVATNVGGTSDAFPSREDKNLIPVDFTTKVLKDRILEFANMSDFEYARMRKSARNLWECKFDAKKNYSKFIKYNFKS